MHCEYDIQGFLKCNNLQRRDTIETFVENENDVQCGFFTQYYDAKNKCEKCCAANGMVWMGKPKDFYSVNVKDYSTPNELRTFCKCAPVEKIKIIPNQDTIVDTSQLNRYNKKVWSVGTTNLSECVDKCVSSDVCRFAVYRNKECWMSDFDPAMTVQTSKNDVFTLRKT
jgi:hypothetical protein